MKSIRHYILLNVVLTFIVGAHSNSQAQEAPDTLIKVDTPSSLLITENSKGSVITVKGINDNDNLETTVKIDYPKNSSVKSSQSVKRAYPIEIPGMHNNKKGWKCYIDGITIGLNRPCGLGANGGLQWSKSIEIGWLNCFAVGYSWDNASLSFGLGFDWRNYKSTTSDRYLTTTPSKGIEWADANLLPEGSILKNSRLKVFSLQFPLLFRTAIPNSCLRLKLGPIFNFNSHYSIMTNYINFNGDSNELFNENIGQRRFTVDFFGSVSVLNIAGLFVRYSPMKVINSIEGINFRPFTIGITLGI